MRRRATRGFTLIEMLIVVCIIGILLSMVFPIITLANNMAQEAQTKTLVGVVKDACDRYEQTHQTYPWLKATKVEKKMLAGLPGEVEIKTAAVYAELSGKGSANTADNFLSGVDGKYKKDLGAGTTLVDARGREIMIRIDPNSSRVVVWSVGRNGKDETNDGATPDANKRPKIYYLFTAGDNGDDKVTR